MKYEIVKEDENSFIIIPELIDLGLKHCFTTKSMDIGSHTNKSLESLKKNFNSIYNFLNINPKTLYSGYQTHSKNIEKIINENQGKENPFGRFIPNTDGLMTNKKNIVLITRFADCTPIILFDSVKRVHGNIHSGWKGTLQEIAANGVDIMVKEYNSNPKDIISVIGPTIGEDDFEVDRDVMIKFRDKFKSYNDIIKKKDSEKYLIDLQKINEYILIDKGIREENITTIDLSTYSNNFLHSYRRDGEDFGLMGLVTCI